MTTLEADPVIIPDEDVNDQDSSLGNDAVSSTQSLTNSILDYRLENGRTYHGYKAGKYALPNDEAENDRLDLQHNLFLMTFDDALGLAPPNDPTYKAQRVLDLGTGTGIWVIDYADEHPEAQVIGVDLSPTQPSWVPPNAEFFVDDIDEEWTYSEPFDYIHSRMMNASISDWKVYLTKCFEALAPGGYVELQEISLFARSDDGTLKNDGQILKWLNLLGEASSILERAYQDIWELKNIMAEVGFTGIEERNFKWPTNSWPRDKKHKTLGVWQNANMSSGLEAFTMAPFTRAHGWTADEVRAFLVGVRRELNNPRIHAYLPILSVYGRKPKD
ncbi:hypothetical protein FALCPG4_015552 [Fusarium falciforme]